MGNSLYFLPKPIFSKSSQLGLLCPLSLFPIPLVKYPSEEVTLEWRSEIKQEGQPCVHMRKKHSRQRAQQGWAPWDWNIRMKVKVKSLSPTPSDPMDCSLPGSSVHGIFQARVLESGAIAFSELSYWGSPFPCMRSTNTNSISVCSLPPFQKNPFFPPWNCTWNPRLKQNGFVWSRNRG